MILIADAHVNVAAGTHRPFFRMLAALEKTKEDIVFMGDIFDLWIALPGFEQAVHHHFLTWCRQQKAHREIGYIEGNHEFFLSEEKGDAFSWATDRDFKADSRGNLSATGTASTTGTGTISGSGRSSGTGLSSGFFASFLQAPPGPSTSKRS